MHKKDHLVDIARAFLAIDEDLRVDAFGSGLINDTYKVSSSPGPAYLLQRLNHFVFREPGVVMENIRKIADFLASQSYGGLILEPIPTLGGEMLHLDRAGNYWRLFPFFENTFSIDQASEPDQVRNGGQAFGEFFRVLAGLDPAEAGIGESIPGFHDSIQRLAFFEEVRSADQVGRGASAKAEIDWLESEKSLFYEIAALPLPLRITHNDTKINNVLFDRETQLVRGVIDWDTIMPGTVLSDFGDMVRTMTPTFDENHRQIEEIDVVLPFFTALCQGFIPAVEAVITEVERRHLVKGAQWITLEQAMRFLTDYLNGDVYYKTAYPEQNLLRTRNQMAFYRALQRGEDTLQSFIH